MLIKEKINLKRYTALSLALLIPTYFVCTGPKEFLVVFFIFVAVIINQFMMMKIVNTMIHGAIVQSKDESKMPTLKLIIKSLIIVIALSFGVLFMKKRIIIPVIIYVMQIFIFYFSMLKSEEN